MPKMSTIVLKMSTFFLKLVHHTGLEPVKNDVKGRLLDSLHYGVLMIPLTLVRGCSRQGAPALASVDTEAATD